MKAAEADAREARRQKLIEMAIRLIASRGWTALSNRNLGKLTRTDRTTISALLPEKNYAREELFVKIAFDVIRESALRVASNGKVNISTIQKDLLVLFHKSDKPRLMARLISIYGTNEEIDRIFNARRRRTFVTLRLCSSFRDSKLDRLIDWYIAACAVFTTNPEIDVGQLPDIGQFLGVRIDD